MQLERDRHPFLWVPQTSYLWSADLRTPICTEKTGKGGQGKKVTDTWIQWRKGGAAKNKGGKGKKKNDTNNAESCTLLVTWAMSQSSWSTLWFLGTGQNPQVSFFFYHFHLQSQLQLPLKGIHLLLKCCSYRKKSLESERYYLSQPPKRTFMENNWANWGYEPQKKQCILTGTIGWQMLRFLWVIMMIL